MMKNSRTISKSIGVLALIVLVAVAFLFPGPVTAAKRDYQDGSYNLQGTFKINDLELSETDFELYWVGGFAHTGGKSTLELFPEYDMVLPEIQAPAKDADENAVAAWQEAWLVQADTLWQKVQASGQDPIRTATTSGNTFNMTGLSNGVYLLVGDAQKVKGYDKNARQVQNKDSWWWPRPMLIQVLNGDVTVQTKPASADTSRFIVEKKWSGDEASSDLVRPKTVDFQVFYDGKQVDTQTLPDKDGNWYFTVEGTNKQDDPSKWSFVEVQTDETKANYMPVVTTGKPVIDEEGEWNKVEYTNIYRPSVIISKKMKDVVRIGEQTTVPLVFQLTGLKNGKEVYHQVAGMQYKLDGDKEQEIKVTDIPWDLDELIVKEVYSAGTKAEDSKKSAVASTDKDGNTVYTVSFSDSGDIDRTVGAINKFKRKGDTHEFDKAVGGTTE
jgi:hypothetical protein